MELDALNGGLGAYSTGALLRLQRSSGASLDDVFALDTSGASFTIVGNSLMNPLGHSFATFSTFGGKLIVTFSGPWATKALVNDVLRHISYTNTSDNPPEGAVDFRWEFFDGNIGAQGSGGELKAVAITQVQFRGVNDAPLNHVPGAQLADQAADLVFGTTHGNAITISDVDAGEGIIIVKLRVEHGTLTLGATDGHTSVTGNGGAVVELRGTLDDVNAALDGLTYRPTAGYAGSDTLRVFTDDVGDSGAGGDKSDGDDVAIFVTPISHPTVAADDSATTAEDTPVTIAVTANDSDPDGLPGVLAINGSSIAPGGSLDVANGRVTLNIDGTLTFTPSAKFNGTTWFSYLAGTGLHYQLFDRTAANSFTSVTQIPMPAASRGSRPVRRHRAGDGPDRRCSRLACATPARSISRPAAATPSTRSRTTARRCTSTAHWWWTMTGWTGRPKASDGRARGWHACDRNPVFESGASEVLQVDVSGPDTANAKTALLQSALLGPATANVEITVNAVNDVPQLADLAGTLATIEQTAVLLAANATVSDAELDALNGGAVSTPARA